MTSLADKSLLSGGDNKPPMLEKHLYDSWKSRMELYMMNRPHGRMILASVEKGPLVWPEKDVFEAVAMNGREFEQDVSGESSNLLDIDSSRSGVIKELFHVCSHFELNKNATVIFEIECVNLDETQFEEKPRSGIEEMAT
ncbi:hypothetical protein Tco_1313963 [Tanacetum coccineum]